MTKLPADNFADFHNPADGKSYYLVHLTNDTVKRYEFAASVSMRSYRHIYDALDNPGAYEFIDDNGVLVIQPKG